MFFAIHCVGVPLCMELVEEPRSAPERSKYARGKSLGRVSRVTATFYPVRFGNQPLVQVSEEECDVRACRVCRCTDEDCTQCIRRTGLPCSWIEDDLCSACATREQEREEEAARMEETFEMLQLTRLDGEAPVGNYTYTPVTVPPAPAPASPAQPERRGHVTLTSVAKAVGVSISTASAVLLGYSTSSEATRLRVREVADRLGYVSGKRVSTADIAAKLGFDTTWVWKAMTLDPHVSYDTQLLVYRTALEMGYSGKIQLREPFAGKLAGRPPKHKAAVITVEQLRAPKLEPAPAKVLPVKVKAVEPVEKVPVLELDTFCAAPPPPEPEPTEEELESLADRAAVESETLGTTDTRPVVAASRWEQNPLAGAEFASRPAGKLARALVRELTPLSPQLRTDPNPRPTLADLVRYVTGAGGGAVAETAIVRDFEAYCVQIGQAREGVAARVRRLLGSTGAFQKDLTVKGAWRCKETRR